MLLIGAIVVYSIIGGMLVGALLTDKHTNTCKQDALFCCIAGPIWPLAIGAAAGFALWDNLKDRRFERTRARREQVQRFCGKLLKLGLISSNTMYTVNRKLNEK
jgi:hypothetical protein